MCFSADASLVSSAILVPAGLYCLYKSLQTNKTNWVFALLPLVFGIQQAIEGGVWWSLETDNTEYLRFFALSFLFFSHFFWLVWVPYSCYSTESQHARKKLFLFITGVGAIFGASMFPQFLLHPEWLDVSIINHSIVYKTTLIYDRYLPRDFIAGVYMLIIMAPLALSSDHYHRRLGALVLFSVMITIAFFDYAFISVWCYFAAVISLYIYYIIIVKERPAACFP